MQNLRFSRLLVLSNIEKSANLFEFSKTMNLVTADDNSVGKSTLLKLLFWTFGCEPDFDTTWKAKDCTALVDFEIGNIKYKIKRYNKQITLKTGENATRQFTQITGEFSKILADILHFKALLPNQVSGKQEVPPPAYYFLPFYIDQKRSWSVAWNNFENLGQYQGWKSTIIKYHVGLLPPEHFEMESEKFDQKEIKKGIDIEIQKINTTIEVVSKYIPAPVYTKTTVGEFDRLTESIKKDLAALQEKQELLLSDIAVNHSEKIHLIHQMEITAHIVSELDADYRFSVENLVDDEIECPLCGTIHDNSIVNRASILVDKAQAENQKNELEKALSTIEKKLTKLTLDLQQARLEIEEINSKYVIDTDDLEQKNFNQIIESIAGNSIRESVIKSKADKILRSDEIEEAIKKMTKEQRMLVTKELIESRNRSFLAIFTQYLKDLDSEAINLSEIQSPLDFNKVIKEGGAAEGARAILAYYLTVYSMVEGCKNEIVSPLVIDTPNQQEQSGSNYDKIIKLLINKLNSNQVIMGAMENEHLQPMKGLAKVITLDARKLLLPEMYDSVKEQIDGLN